ncbi:MAG TPA: signal peptidase II [Clostridia bacterium]|nr:signal peptidase II [Clostridia bacterium]
MLEIIIFIVVIALDQVTKAVCASWLPTLPNNTYPIFEGVFSLTYVENRGAAFGMLQNMRVFFLIMTVLVCGALVYILIRERGKMHLVMRISLALILVGALGNFVDRLLLGFVRDMFYFELINFAIFNVADASISVGATMLILDLLFFKGRKYVMDKPAKRDDGGEENKGET